GPGPMHPRAKTRREWWADWDAELRAATGFDSPEARSYRWQETYTTAAYVEVLSTHSDHIVLGEDRLQELARAVAEVLERHGGIFALDYISELWMARATGEPAAPSG